MATTAAFWGEDAHVEDLNIWSLPSGEKKTGITGVVHQPDYSVVALTVDGARVALASQGMLRIWSTSDADLLNEIELPVSLPRTLEFSPDGRFIGLHDQRARTGTGILDIESQSLITRWSYPRPFQFINEGQSYLAWHSPPDSLTGLYEHRVPATLLPPKPANDQLSLRWIGRDGRFQVQHRPTFVDAWEDVGEPTVAREAIIPIENTSGFFRLLEIEQ